MMTGIFFRTVPWWLQCFALSLGLLLLVDHRPLAAQSGDSAEKPSTSRPAGSSQPVDTETAKQEKELSVVIIPVKDGITGRYEVFFRRVIREANEEGVSLLVIDMKTPGGSLQTTMELFDILETFNGRTVTFVNDEAYSAGALIAAATQAIYMTPDSVMGAATAIMVGPGGAPMELPESVDAKFSSALRAKIRSKAAINGHRPDVFEAMIDRKLKLEVDGEVLCDEGEILTLTGEEAFTSYGDPPKPLVAAGLVEDMDQLLEELGYADARRIEAVETGSETLGYWLDFASPVILLIALAGLYLEFKSPGFGVPGLIGIVAASLYFIGGNVAGFSTMAWLIVFVVGVILIFGEVLVFPGTFVLGVTGAVLMAVSILMAFLDYDPNRAPQTTESQPALPESASESARKAMESTDSGSRMTTSEYLMNALNKRFRELGVVFVGLIASMIVLAKVLPHTPYYARIVSQTASGMDSVQEEKQRHSTMIGQVGTAINELRPGGKARFGNTVLDVISDDGIIEPGTPVEIISYSTSTARVIQATRPEAGTGTT